jgi:hypothetical protein
VIIDTTTTMGGKRMELALEEEDGSVFIEVRDWDTGKVAISLDFDGSMDDLRAKILTEQE